MRDLPFKQKFSLKRFLSSDEKAVEFSDEILFGMSLDPPWQLALSAIAVLAPMPMSELATPLSFFISKELRAEPCIFCLCCGLCLITLRLQKDCLLEV